jgi:hypothetical protein
MESNESELYVFAVEKNNPVVGTFTQPCTRLYAIGEQQQIISLMRSGRQG